jgi:hypothetical protein
MRSRRSPLTLKPFLAIAYDEHPLSVLTQRALPSRVTSKRKMNPTTKMTITD